jgi:hypothetical protein
MRKFTPLLAAAVLLGACTDEARSPISPQTRVENTEFDTGPMGLTDQYWKTGTELWVYDDNTELGYSSHLPYYELYQTGINQIRDGGARMMRIDVDWGVVDPSGYGPLLATNCLDCPPLHNALDNFVDNVERAQRTSVVPVVVVHGTPSAHQYYNSSNGWAGATPSQIAVARQEFTRFMSQLVQLAPSVKFWQILNEPDGGHHGVAILGGGAFTHAGSGRYTFDRNAQGRNYAALMQSVYPAVKAQNPNAWVLMAALTGTPYMDAASMPIDYPGWDFLHGFYQNGGKPYVDFMAIHAYGRATNDATGFTDKANAVLAVMGQYGDAKRPLWLTEFGHGAAAYHKENGVWPSSNAGAAFDAHQNAFFADALYHLQFGNKFQKALVYNLSASLNESPPAGIVLPSNYSCGNNRDGSAKQNCEPADYSTGLFRNDNLTARPAFYTIRGHGINHFWLFNGFGYGDITVSTYQRPVGYSYTRYGGTITIHGVTVNKLFPTRIMFEDEPVDPPPPCEGGVLIC